MVTLEVVENLGENRLQLGEERSTPGGTSTPNFWFLHLIPHFTASCPVFSPPLPPRQPFSVSLQNLVKFIPFMSACSDGWRRTTDPPTPQWGSDPNLAHWRVRILREAEKPSKNFKVPGLLVYPPLWIFFGAVGAPQVKDPFKNAIVL